MEKTTTTNKCDWDLTGLTEAAIVGKLRERFFWVAATGGQQSLYDVMTRTGGLNQGHILGAMVACGAATEMAKKLAKELSPPTLKAIVSKPKYRPKCGPVIAEGGLNWLNSWVAPTVTPNPALDASPFVKHLQIALGTQEKVDFFLDLLAYRYQFPERPKPHAVCYYYQADQGNGKSLLAKTLQAVFGESAVNVASEQKMQSGSKVELWTSTLLIAEECDVTKGSATYDMIKTYSGMDAIKDDVKHKGFDTYDIPASLIMLSNRAPTFIEPQDRRFHVSEWVIPLEKEAKVEYFKTYTAWLDQEGSYSAIAGLLATREITRDMFAPVPVTHEKLNAMAVGQDECVRDVRDFLKDNPKALAFVVEDFKAIWEKHNVTSANKYKLQDAGLIPPIKRRRVDGEDIYLWLRQGHSVNAIKSQGTYIVTPDGQEIAIKEALHDWKPSF